MTWLVVWFYFSTMKLENHLIRIQLPSPYYREYSLVLLHCKTQEPLTTIRLFYFWTFGNTCCESWKHLRIRDKFKSCGGTVLHYISLVSLFSCVVFLNNNISSFHYRLEFSHAALQSSVVVGRECIRLYSPSLTQMSSKKYRLDVSAPTFISCRRQSLLHFHLDKNLLSRGRRGRWVPHCAVVGRHRLFILAHSALSLRCEVTCLAFPEVDMTPRCVQTAFLMHR